MTGINKVQSALLFIASNDRDTWIRMGMAIHSELGDAGFFLWDTWSQSADNYNQRDTESAWKSFTFGAGITIGTLFHHAQQDGWTWGGPEASPEDIVQQKAKLEIKNKAAESDRKAKQEIARQNSNKLCEDAQAANDEHPHLVRKQCLATETLRQLPIDDVVKIIGYHPKSSGQLLRGEILLVPVKIDGNISTIEMIDCDSRKSAVSGGRKSGGYWAAQEMPEVDSPDITIAIGEGVSTVLSVKQATGYPVVAALTCHNLKPVAQQIKKHYPSAKIIILSDRGNGQKEAEQSAIETGSLLAVPEFPEGVDGTDFNDLLVAAGADEVKKQIVSSSVLLEAQASLHPESIQTIVDKLTELTPLEYDQVRDAKAKELGVRVSALDKAVQEQRKQKVQQQQSLFPSDEPWPDSVDGEDLIHELCQTFERFSVLPSGSSLALSLWAILTYCYDQFRVLPLILITAPEKRCGKSMTLTTLSELCYRSMTASNISPAAMYRTIEKYHPTLLVDEADTFLKGNDDLRSILNSGHTKTSAYVVRCDGEDHDPKPFSTWSPKALAMIGLPPDTVLDRSIVVPLRRKLQGEEVASDDDRDKILSQILRRKIAAFVEDNLGQIKIIRPERLVTNNDRLADNWKPLLSIAGAISDQCLELARAAATELVDDKADENISVQLLADIKEVFQADRISSKALVYLLVSLEERPWWEWKKGRPMTTNTLGKMLKPFEIRSSTIRDGDDVYRGYKREDFKDVFKRYLPQSPLEMEPKSVTTLQVNDISHLSGKKTVTSNSIVTLSNQDNMLESLSCNNVTARKGDTGARGSIEKPLRLIEEDFFDFGEVN